RLWRALHHGRRLCRQRHRLGPELRQSSGTTRLRCLCGAAAGAAPLQGGQGRRQQPDRGDAAMSVKWKSCLWFNNDAEEAARFYVATFPDTAITHLLRAPSDYPAGREGDVLVVELTLMGTPVTLLNGG